MTPFAAWLEEDFAGFDHAVLTFLHSLAVITNLEVHPFSFPGNRNGKAASFNLLFHPVYDTILHKRLQ